MAVWGGGWGSTLEHGICCLQNPKSPIKHHAFFFFFMVHSVRCRVYVSPSSSYSLTKAPKYLLFSAHDIQSACYWCSRPIWCFMEYHALYELTHGREQENWQSLEARIWRYPVTLSGKRKLQWSLQCDKEQKAYLHNKCQSQTHWPQYGHCIWESGCNWNRCLVKV